MKLRARLGALVGRNRRGHHKGHGRANEGRELVFLCFWPVKQTKKAASPQLCVVDTRILPFATSCRICEIRQKVGIARRRHGQVPWACSLWVASLSTLFAGALSMQSISCTFSPM